MTASRAEIGETVRRLVDEVSGWEHVATGEHRFGGTEFRIGPREIGHVHAWGMLDIAYFRRLRDALVAADLTGVHHLLAESGWTTYRIGSAEDFDHARWLLRLSYLYHVSVLQKTSAGGEELADVDVASELEGMDPSDEVRGAFERRPAA